MSSGATPCQTLPSILTLASLLLTGKTPNGFELVTHSLSHSQANEISKKQNIEKPNGKKLETCKGIAYHAAQATQHIKRGDPSTQHNQKRRPKYAAQPDSRKQALRQESETLLFREDIFKKIKAHKAEVKLKSCESTLSSWSYLFHQLALGAVKKHKLHNKIENPSEGKFEHRTNKQKKNTLVLLFILLVFLLSLSLNSIAKT